MCFSCVYLTPRYEALGVRQALTVESTIVLGNFSSFEGVNHAMQRLRVIGIDQFLRDVGFPLFPIFRITAEESGLESFQSPMKKVGDYKYGTFREH